VAVIALVAVVAGWTMAQASGRRQAGETVTGADALPRTATQEARACIELTSAEQAGRAVTCYRDVLDRDPDNPTALTYLGWTLVLSAASLPDDTVAQAIGVGEDFLDRAVESDPTFAEAYAFRAVIAERQGRIADAKADLDRLDTLDPPPEVRALTKDLRDRVERALRTTTTATTVPG